MITRVNTGKWTGYQVTIKGSPSPATPEPEDNTPAGALILDAVAVDVTPVTPDPTPEPIAPEYPESAALRAWFDALDPAGWQKDKDGYAHLSATFYKYDVTVYAYESDIKGTGYGLLTRSPQSKSWGRGSFASNSGWGKTLEDLRPGLERFIAERERKEAASRDRTAAKKAARESFVNPYHVGEFLYSSWGYDQTNREFYQILAVRPTSIKVREVCQDRTRDSYDSGQCSPIRDSFVKNEPERWISLQIDERGRHSVPSPIHGNLYSWDGKPVYYSDGH